MAASPASTMERQRSPAESRQNTPAETVTTTTATRPSSHATDDEILGLTTNIRRKDWTESQGGAGADAATQDQSQVSAKVTSDTDRTGTQKAPKVGDDAKDYDTGPTADHLQTAGDPAAEPVHLQAAFETNPELRAAWHDAKSYREAFPTPEAARAATGMLADLNRMDTLFFSQRPEDHAQLAHAWLIWIPLRLRRSLAQCRRWRKVPVLRFRQSPRGPYPIPLETQNPKSRSLPRRQAGL